MKNINSSQLAFLLKIKKKDASDMIEYCHLKEGNQNISFAPRSEEEIEQHESDYDDFISIDVFEKHKGIKIKEALNDIEFNYLLRSATRKYILEYPLKKFVLSKTGHYPNYIRIPTPLRTMLSYETKHEILELWTTHYAYMIGSILGFKID